MVVVKGMDMPCGCWDCECVYENYSGATACMFTHRPLYPIGGEAEDKRDKDCPLAEISEVSETP